MSRTNSDAIHSEAFSARIEAVEALRMPSAKRDVSHVRNASEKLRGISAAYGLAPNAAVYDAFADLTEILSLLLQWRSTLLDAGTEAQRFLIAAKARCTAWLTKHGENASLAALTAVARLMTNVQDIADVDMLADKLAAIPLPIGIYTIPTRDALRLSMGVPLADDDTPRPEPVAELAVAFVRFSIDGTPLNEVHHITPGETHDMDVEVRVSRWPKDATHLVLDPVTVEPAGTYSLPKFELEAPLGDTGPFKLGSQGRMMLSVPNHIHARPFEFKYAARFVPSASEQPVAVVGQRTLLLEGVDLARSPLTGYRAIDKKLIDIRNTLRVVPHVDQQEISDALTVAFALGNYAGQTVQDNLFDTAIGEAEFQRRTKSFLRSQPKIGAALEEHPHAAGGITDLSFKGIRIELKSESAQTLTLASCERFMGQTTSYVVGTGKHIGILCVLDCSTKSQPPFPAEDGIGVFQLQHADGTPVYVIAFVLQGNLAKPSSLSR